MGALFLTNGALFANLLPRYPQIKAELGISNVAYGLAVAAFPAGAMVAGLAAGTLIRRFGSARAAVAGTIATSVLILIAGTAPGVAVFVAALFVAGAMDAITDVAQNAHGLEVQRRYGRSIINSFHATWSIGAVVGGSMAAGAIALGLPRGAHLAISAVLFSTVALVALQFCLPHATTSSTDGSHAGPPQRASTGIAARTIAILAALVVIALAGAVVEDAGMSWAAIYLSGSLDASATLAAAGYVTLVSAQFVGRLVGDRLVDRFGERAVARTGGLITAAGMTIALAAPSVPTTILGFAAAGLGVATLVPTAMHQADQLPGLKPGTGLTIVSWLMRLGFLLAPPVVGWIADSASLRAGLLVVPAAGLTVMVLAGVLPPDESRREPARRDQRRPGAEPDGGGDDGTLTCPTLTL